MINYYCERSWWSLWEIMTTYSIKNKMNGNLKEGVINQQSEKIHLNNINFTDRIVGV